MDAIIELASQIKSVNLSISSFIPKPHSEFEREGMDDIETLKDKREYLRARAKGHNTKRNLKMDFHDPAMSRIEGILSRGDRDIGGIIYRVWQKGARLQAWTEYFDYDFWKGCFEEYGIDPQDYLKKRDKNDFLPWDFVET